VEEFKVYKEFNEGILSWKIVQGEIQSLSRVQWRHLNKENCPGKELKGVKEYSEGI
jgi:hypothetical protein